MACDYDYISLSVENIITVSDEYVPLTGVYSVEEEILGWEWDKRSVEGINVRGSRYKTPIGGHTVGLKDGTTLEQWLSGTVQGLDYKDIVTKQVHDVLTWTPRVETGNYRVYWDSRSLFSDYSHQQVFDPALNENGVNVLSVRDDCFTQSININLFRRYPDASILSLYKPQFVSSFTGQLSGGSRLATEDSNGNILWSNIETRKQEYIVRDTTVYLNTDYSLSIGQVEEEYTALDVCVIEGLLESKGMGSEEGRRLYTDYFPLVSTSVALISIDPLDNISEWERRDSLNFAVEDEKVFMVDPDLGVVITGGFKAPNLVLKQALDEDDIEVVCYLDLDSMDLYPDQGILQIGSERIAYFGKERDTFINCIRGYLGTVAAVHAAGVKVENVRRGLGTDDDLYLAYIAMPRIDYEITAADTRTTNINSWLDIQPTKNIETNNVLQIVSNTAALESILLEIDKPSLGGNLYGPLFYSTDVGKLTATAFDPYGNPLPDIQLRIEIIDPGKGRLDGLDKEKIGLTNSLGQLYAFYNAPFQPDEVENLVSSVTIDGDDTVLTVDETLEPGVLTQDIWLQQVLKHDKIIGTTGLLRTIMDVSSSAPPYGLTRLEIDALLTEEYEDGFVYILGTDNVRYFRRITFLEETTDTGGSPVTAIHIEPSISGSLVNGQSIWLFEREATEWKAALLNGIRYIVYTWDDNVQHPVTGATGAFAPLQPASFSGTSIRYSDVSLSTPDPDDVAVNLGAYVIIAPSVVSLRASGRDPFSGNVIVSNTIRVSLTLNKTLIGVDRSGTLPVPHGWTFVTEEFNVGTALGGANFITINPTSS